MGYCLETGIDDERDVESFLQGENAAENSPGHVDIDMDSECVVETGVYVQRNINSAYIDFVESELRV